MTEEKQKIIPHLWFDKEAKEAAKFYISLFPESKITNTITLQGTPSGDSDIASFELTGYQFMAISAGPLFKLNPSISFFLNFDPSIDKNARNNLDVLWEKLSQDGKVLLPFDKYPFSEHYVSSVVCYHILITFYLLTQLSWNKFPHYTANLKKSFP
ncbi:MAG: VOC family protein [Candidatus Bathyarchaeota archaeon]|nr:MAG: VOC family protein [Candidatus Bathyarchaeota archaeon]